MAFNLQAFLKTHKDAAKKDLWGDNLQTYVTSHEGDWDSKPVGPPKTTTAKPPKTTIAQSAPKDAGTKPKPKPTFTLSDKDKLALKRLGGVSGGISLPNVDLGSLSQITETIKKKVTATDLSGGHSLNTDQDLTKADLSGGHSLNTEQDLSGGHSLNTKPFGNKPPKVSTDLLQDQFDATAHGAFVKNFLSKYIEDAKKITVPKVDLGSLSQFTEKVKTDVGGGFEELKENIDTAYKGSTLNIGLENLQKEGQKAITQIKQEGQKLLEGDFNLERAVTGTIKGMEDTYKGSDAHSVLQQTEDFFRDPTKGIRDYAKDVKEEGEAVINQYKKAGENIVTTGENIGKAFEDTFNTGMNVSTALGSNAAKQVMKAKSDLSSALTSALTSAFGSSKGAGPKIGKTTSVGDLLERDRDKRRGGLSRSGTSRTLITGKY